MDLMGPIQVKSLAGKSYALVCVDGFSRYTWVDFIKKNQIHLMCSENYVRRLKMNKIVIFSELGVIMEENLKTVVLNNIVIYIEFHMSFPHLLL